MGKHKTDLRQLSGLLKRTLANPDYQTVADYGAGMGEEGPELARAEGKTLLRYDKSYVGDPDWEPLNLEYACRLPEADVLISANVLNVITDDLELDAAVDTIATQLRHTKTRTALISTYKAPEPSPTQRAEPSAAYAIRFKTRHPDLEVGLSSETLTVRAP